MHPTTLWRYSEATFDQDSDQEPGTKTVIADTEDIMDTADTEGITTLWSLSILQHHHLRE